MEKINAGVYHYQKEFTILVVTNNPYIERQSQKTQIEVNKVLKASGLADLGYSVKVEGVGFQCKQDLPVIKSEFAVLVSVWFEYLNGSTNMTPLLFQSMDKTPISEVPYIEPEGFSISGLVEKMAINFWDEILE